MYADWFCILGVNFLEKNAIGWWFWLNTEPIPIPEVSVSKMNGLEKSGWLRTVAEWLLFVELQMLRQCGYPNENFPFLIMVNGAAIVA